MSFYKFTDGQPPMWTIYLHFDHITYVTYVITYIQQIGITWYNYADLWLSILSQPAKKC